MRRISKGLLLATLLTMQAALLMPLGAVRTANAALAAFSPNPATIINPPVSAQLPNHTPGAVQLGGIPAWYQDINGVAVEPCLVPATCGLIGLGDPMFNEALPLSYPDNFPTEAFYSDAVAIFPVGQASARVILAMEYTFIDPVTGALIGAPPRPANALGVPFQRHRLTLSYPPGVPVPTAGNFTITHPWGSTVFTFGEAKCVNNAGGQKCTMTRDLPLPGAIPPSFVAALGTGIAGTQSTFLSDPLAPPGFLGSATAVASFTGAVAPNVNSISVSDGLGNTGSTAALTLLVGKKIGLDVQPGSNQDFGALLMPAVSVPHTITITNTTGNSILFAALASAGADALDFTIAPPTAAGAAPFCSAATVAAAGKCSFDITFNPAAAAKAARVATIALAPTTVQPVPPVVPPLSDPPPVTMNLTGIAQVKITTALASPHGTITPDATVDPVTGGAPAGSPVTFTVTPSNKKFKVKDLSDVAGANAAVTVAAPFTINTGSLNHTVTATFMQSGDLDADGSLGISDALKALKIVAGVQLADVDDPNNSAVKVAPLVGGVPAAIDAKATPDIGDVLVILRRVLGVDLW